MDDVMRLIGALGNSGAHDAVDPLVALAAAAEGNPARLRAAALALGRLADPAGAPVLAKGLAAAGPGSDLELVLACALVRCGDQAGLGRRTLMRIAGDENGPSARLAWQVLSTTTPTRP